MILAFDVGNTHVTVGAFEGEDLLGQWRFASEPRRTEDEYGPLVSTAIGELTVDGVIIASVVPALTGTFVALSRKYFELEPLLLDARSDVGVALKVDHPDEVGADRVANALAAHKLIGGPAVVMDLGSATTFDCVDAKGAYHGGAILLGPNLMAQTLARKTAQLPNVSIEKPKRVIGRNTIECIQAGLFHGYLGMLEHVLELTLKEMGGKPKLILTGGLAGAFAPHLSRKGTLLPDLTLQGLRLGYQILNERKGRKNK